MKLILWGLACLALAAVSAGIGMWLFGSREPVVTDIQFDDSVLQGGVDAYLAAQEARFDDITPGVAKRVEWANEPEQITDWVIVYLHGFSATSEEIRPVPDLVAQELGANLVYTRLQGHGRDGDTMATASVEGWMRDIAEALAIARKIGRKTLVIGTSTGASLATLAAQEEMSAEVAAYVLISPNFKLKSPAAALLVWPGARWWLPKLAGETRSFTPSNEDHATYWTNSYPTRALLPMAAAVQAVKQSPPRNVSQPALFVFDDLDQVIDHAQTRVVAAQWGGPTSLHVVEVGPEDDPNRHVIAGHVLSPHQSVLMAQHILGWIKDLDDGTTD
ncbi:Thermostable monoacylglycerol lipase [Pelagimonas phthalicica]|uniref:Thermostable monoacylglycerol lipase n=1 Tax=Pelagimonas phthalicica TaxID=1037362 RepID=A0A238JEG1_9RHOB|nr:alpha/beta fold hydrolase [Pelagimonas phthalicica]TDS91998.1 alpha-beta hydrolase superfamily lysophospholipase [Pelagimonas phthalicica]SMX29048.1 Thermostable monoacylglycerol lipase [Pelagimonas phthalicica]